MTKVEALQAMKAGKKITHQYYTSDEYLQMIGGMIYSEDGYRKGDELDEFWQKIQKWEDGWSIYNS
jgi:hypothetical protein